MTKVYPNVAGKACPLVCDTGGIKTSTSTDATVVLTVWKKSLLLNCNGFTVFDAQGNLVFRVDNYVAGRKDRILLMDAAGTPLLTIRRKRLGFGDNWLVFEGESVKPLFTARKNVNILNSNSSKCLAYLFSSGSNSNESYEMEGSYTQRCCTVYDNQRRRVAEIKRKEAAVGGVAFGVDVFRLIVYPAMDTTLAMACVILLDHMFGSSSRTR